MIIFVNGQVQNKGIDAENLKIIGEILEISKKYGLCAQSCVTGDQGKAYTLLYYWKVLPYSTPYIALPTASMP